MIPLVLGGIALAAVGYGVKEYCEENGCPWDDEDSYTPPKPSNVFADLHREKTTLHEEILPRLRTLLLRVENADKKLRFDDKVSFYEEKFEDAELKEDLKVYASIYKNILNDASSILDVYTDEIERMLESSVDYGSHDKSHKKIIKKTYKFINETQKLLALQLVEKQSEVVAETVVALIDYRKRLEKHKGFANVH